MQSNIITLLATIAITVLAFPIVYSLIKTLIFVTTTYRKYWKYKKKYPKDVIVIHKESTEQWAVVKIDIDITDHRNPIIMELRHKSGVYITLSIGIVDRDYTVMGSSKSRLWKLLND